ncbi:MAG: winged helix-turn-helix transcriptional regulator [Solirubrobacterales bacterium]
MPVVEPDPADAALLRVGPCSAWPEDGRPIRELLDRVGDKWSLLIIGMLGERPMRFSELLRTVDGISQRMLTLTLRHLERDGLVTRTAYAEVPPRVEYALTELGTTLLEPVLALAGWASANHLLIAENRKAFATSQTARHPGRP